MPGYDGTGPWGRGSGTGWGRGPCGTGQRRGGGRGWGMGAGGGWGFAGGGYGRGAGGGGAFRGRGFGPFGPGGAPGGVYGSESPQQEAQALKEEEGYLRKELEALQERIARLEQQGGAE